MAREDDASLPGERQALPHGVELGPSDWREVADAQRVERVWLRLEESLATRRKPGRWAASGWASAASVAAFGLGYLVGQVHGSASSAPVQVLSREPAGVGAQSATREPRSLPGAELSGRADETLPRRDSDRVARRRVPPKRAPSPVVHPEQERRALPAAPEPADTVAEEVAPAAAVPGGEAPALPTWQRLANGGEYEAALYELGQAGGFEQAVVESTPEQLLLLGDIARATGQRQRAVAALRRIVSEFPNDAAAPLAAWSLGNMLEHAGDHAGAIEAFSAYRTLSPGGDFAEDALVRELEAAVEQGDRAQVLRLAEHYESQFPDGRRSEEVARWEAAFEAEPAPGADAGAGVPTSAEF